MGLVTTGRPSDLLSTLVYPPVAITGTTALSSTAFGKLHVCADAGSPANYTVTLPDPTGNAGKFIGFRMAAALTKLVTIAHHASETIDGAASRVRQAGETVTLETDGTDWFKFGQGNSVAMTAKLRRYDHSSVNAVQAITGSVDKIAFNSTAADSTGQMSDVGNSRLICRRTGTYFVDGQAFFQSLNADQAFISVHLYINGSEYGAFNFSAFAGGYPSNPYLGYVSLTAGDTVELYVNVFTGTEHLYGDTTGPASYLSLKETDLW